MEKNENKKLSKGQKLTILLVVLLLLCGLYFGITRWKAYMEDQQLAQAEANATMVVQMENLQDLSYYNGTNVIAFSKDKDGTWMNQEDESFPVDQTAMTGFETLLSGLPADRVFDNPDALSVYGLDKPAYYISATNADGNTAILNIGNEVNGAYYAYVEGSAIVYTIGEDAVTLCNQELYDFVLYEKFPQISSADIQTIAAKSEDGTITVYRTDGTDDIKGNSQTGSFMVTEDDVNTEVKDMDTVNTILNNTAAITFNKCINYDASEEDQAYYQLQNADKTLTVTYLDGDQEKTVQLNLGSVTDENGDYYYVSMNDSSEIVLVDATTIDNIFEEISQLTVTE